MGDDETFYRFHDPFTITFFSAVVSSSNPGAESVGFQVTHGTNLSSTTNLFSATQHASSSTTEQVFANFNDATLVDGAWLSFRVTSASTEAQAIAVNMCGDWDI